MDSSAPMWMGLTASFPFSGQNHAIMWRFISFWDLSVLMWFDHSILGSLDGGWDLPYSRHLKHPLLELQDPVQDQIGGSQSGLRLLFGC